MKANELIKGAFVYFNCFDGSKIVVRVTGFNDGIVYGDSKNGSHWCNFEKVEPIPITPEILSEWGFTKNKTGQMVIEKKHSIGCCGQTCSNTNPLEYAVWWDRFGLGCVSYLEKEGNITLDGTTYVHQLQQILGLFDLDKFIKIEL